MAFVEIILLLMLMVVLVAPLPLLPHMALQVLPPSLIQPGPTLLARELSLALLRPPVLPTLLYLVLLP